MIRLDDASAAIIVDTLRRFVGGGEDAIRVADNIQQQLDQPQWSGDMIERIAGYIMRPNARNMLGGDALTALRQHLLSPRELQQVEAAVQKGVVCINCGKGVRSGEIATVSAGHVVCARCAQPTGVRCTCNTLLNIDIKAKVARAMRECSICKSKAEGKETQVAEPIPDGAVINRERLNEMLNQAPMPRPRAGGPLRNGENIFRNVAGRQRVPRIGDRLDQDAPAEAQNMAQPRNRVQEEQMRRMEQHAREVAQRNIDRERNNAIWQDENGDIRGLAPLAPPPEPMWQAFNAVPVGGEGRAMPFPDAMDVGAPDVAAPLDNAPGFFANPFDGPERER